MGTLDDEIRFGRFVSYNPSKGFFGGLIGDDLLVPNCCYLLLTN
jgi:hypothetical protein